MQSLASSPCVHPRAPPRRTRMRAAACALPAAQVPWSDADKALLRRAAELADSDAGLCAPHPKSGCVLVDRQGTPVAEASQFGQGGARAEVLAALAAKGTAAGGTAYLNIEPVHGPCAGESAGVEALQQCGVTRVVLGLLHPLPRLRGQAHAALLAAGLRVDVLSQADASAEHGLADTLQAMQRVNEALLHRVATGLPFSVWKYAMTLDGKIATRTGHSAWVSGPAARERVYLERARSDAVIIGGGTLRQDNPKLTTRQEGGHTPARVVMSRSMDLPEDATLWDVSVAPTIVMTQRGSRRDFQARLTAKGVEVLEFEQLTPQEVMRYCHSRGYLQCLWECGGSLAAPAVSGGVIHKVHTFVAPKLIGGHDAPTPLGDLGLYQMTDALSLSDVTLELVGPDLLISGYLPASGGLSAVSKAPAPVQAAAGKEVRFYKGWGEYGALSNFSPHSVRVASDAEQLEWSTVEAFYQAQKFAGVDTPEARAVYQAIRAARAPEAAAKIGRAAQRQQPKAVRADWEAVKEGVMLDALRAKFSRHAAARAMLLSTGDATLVEDSPHDPVWGIGRDGTGTNRLGFLLQQLRKELRQSALQ